MKHLPFSVFKRTDRPCYLVSFKNEVTGEYLPAISTKKKTEAEAIKTAFVWLRDGVPSKESRTEIKRYSLRDMAKGADLAKADVVFICKELKRRGFLKSYVLTESQQAIDFGGYLRGFWDYEQSAYIKEKLRKLHGIHRRYVIGQAQNAEKYWISFFSGKALREITWADVDAFILHLESLPLSPKSKNKIIAPGRFRLNGLSIEV